MKTLVIEQHVHLETWQLIAFAILAAMLIGAFAAARLTDWSGRVIDRLVEDALNDRADR